MRRHPRVVIVTRPHHSRRRSRHSTSRGYAAYVQDRWSPAARITLTLACARAAASVLRSVDPQANPDRGVPGVHESAQDAPGSRHGDAARGDQLGRDGARQHGAEGVLRPLLLQLRRSAVGPEHGRHESQGLQVPGPERQPALRRPTRARRSGALGRRQFHRAGRRPEDAVRRRNQRRLRATVLGRVVAARRIRAEDGAERVRHHQRAARRAVHAVTLSIRDYGSTEATSEAFTLMDIPASLRGQVRNVVTNIPGNVGGGDDNSTCGWTSPSGSVVTG